MEIQGFQAALNTSAQNPPSLSTQKRTGEHKWFKRFIAGNPRVLNGYSYQVFFSTLAT